MKYSIAFACLFILACHGISWGQGQSIESVHTLSELLAQVEVGAWETARQSQGITLKYRDVTLENNRTTRQILAEFTLTAETDSILASLKDSDKLEAWNEGFRQCKILEEDGSTWVTHAVYNIPYPLSQQDLVAEYRLQREQNGVIIQTCSRPNYMAPIKGYEREQFNLGQWTLSPKTDGRVNVTFTAITLSSSSVPNFIKDPIIQRKLISSFTNLKQSLYSRT